MNNIVAFHEERELVYLSLDEFLKNETTPLQNIILKLPLSNQNLKFDCAKISYKEWNSKGLKASNRTRHIVSPVKGTLRDNTTLNLFERFFKKSIIEGASPSTIKGYLFTLVRILKDLDSLDVETCWSDENSQLNLYKKYSEQLYLEFQLALKDEKKTNAYYTQQSFFASLIGFNLNIDKLKVKKIAWQAPLQPSNHRQPVGKSELKKVSNTNLLIFRKIKSFLMENKVFPLIIESKKLDIYCVESHTNRVSEYYDMFIGAKGEFLDYDQAKTNYLKIKKNIHDARIRAIYERYKELHEERNKPFNLFRIRLINKAVNAFVACIFCDSSVNPSLITQFKTDSFNNPIATNKTIRTYVIKDRSKKGNKIPVAFTVTFKSIVKEFLEFREWVINNVPLDPTFDTSSLLFSIAEQERKSEDQVTRLISPYKNEHYAGAYKNWFKAKFPSVDYLTASVTRATISNFFNENSNSSVVTAEKLGNTPKTVEHAYTEATPEQFHNQMNEYFDAVYKTSYQRNRVSDKPIPVKIAVNEIRDNQTTPTGQCSSVQNPQLNAGFQNISQPTCSNPTSCLFCDKYVFHVDSIDIKKLLSLKEMTFLSINRNKEDEVLYIRYRIDEILEQAVAAYPETAEIIRTMEKDIADGNYAEYWQEQIDLITELMDY
ncbi:hypothetical protein ACT4WE_14375 [Acinetobacter baumannii]